ncbi:MAG: type VI secretion system baseplate subunit TssG [Granulosicoccus sp.]|nr:type VI secretion system baseplate subunit TssG [Granulosicoccus sp.]
MAGSAGDKKIAIDSPDTLLEDLAENLNQFDFVSAVRAIECRHADKPRQGAATRLTDERLRLSQRPSTAFMGTALDGFEIRERKQPYRLYCNFMGLLGTNGPLPLHYTEYADQRARHNNDPTFLEFLDLFNHRMLSLFYKAMAITDPALNQDRPDKNRFNAIVGALAGLEPAASNNRDCVPDFAKYYYAGWMGSQAKSPEGVSSMVSDYFDLSCEVREFEGDWLDLPGDALARLGSADSATQLGISVYLGRRVWSIGHKFVLSLGPLSWDDYLSFKPGGRRGRELYDLVRNYIGDEWAWDLELIIQRKEIGAVKLDGRAGLGFTSFLAQDRSRTEKIKSVKISSRALAAAVH